MGLTITELEELLTGVGEKPYRGRQLFQWLYGHGQTDINEITSLPGKLRRGLAGRCEIRGLTLEKRTGSADGTQKFAFKLEDGHLVEAVLIPEDDRTTVCLSSQAGCALACRFCATGGMGFLRNLTAGEIVGQLIYLRDMLGPDSLTNVVFMGMGEPLLNFDHLASSLQIMTSGQGFGMSPRKIVVSTCGITLGIMRLAESHIRPRLALSLNAATQDKRSRLMPVAEKYSLDELMTAVRHYAAVTGLPVTFEYVLFQGINDTHDDIAALAGLVDSIPCKINVLSYNPISGLKFKRPTDRQVDWFGRELSSRVAGVTVRQSRGRDIAAACGQLATQIRK